MLEGLAPRDINLLVAAATLGINATLFAFVFSILAVFFIFFFVALFIVLVLIFFLFLGTIAEAELFPPVGLDVRASQYSLCLKTVPADLWRRVFWPQRKRSSFPN